MTRWRRLTREETEEMVEALIDSCPPDVRSGWDLLVEELESELDFLMNHV